MDLNQFTQYFDNPKVSIFNRSQLKEFPLYLGQFVPARWDLLSFGNSSKGNSGHKMRMAPMIAPNFANMRVQEHTGVVPLRVIMQDYEERFNYATNRDGSSLPHWSAEEYHAIIRHILSYGYSLTGTLLDFLGYPIYTDLYKAMREAISRGDFYLPHATSSDIPSRDIFFIPQTVSQYESFRGVQASLVHRGVEVSWTVTSSAYTVKPFYRWLLDQTEYAADGRNTYVNFLNDFPSPNIESYVSVGPYETVDSMVNAYFNYLFGITLSYYLNAAGDLPEQSYSTLPLRAFWRIYYDWLTNGNFVDRDSLLEYRVYDFEETVRSFVNDSDDGGAGIIDLFRIPSRLWSFDFFTSLLPTAAIDNAIEIPANSTVLDLAKLTALQKLALRLSYSSRYRDVVWNIFKIKPSDARLQQSTIIARTNHNVGIGEVLQTSETSVSGVLGSFGGRGYSSGRSKGHHVFCEEPCVIIDFVSLVPSASYKDALHPLIHVDDILDFPIPDMDVLGNQPIRADLASGNPYDFDTIMGYGRQYQEWLGSYNTVHGDFRTTLDYWQLTRSFNEVPVINDDFLRMNPADDFDKIFSVPNAPHAFISIYYDVKVTRHVHRSVRIAI